MIWTDEHMKAWRKLSEFHWGLHNSMIEQGFLHDKITHKEQMITLLVWGDLTDEYMNQEDAEE